MKVIINMAALVCILSLTGCTGMFESKTCGIRNSQWMNLSSAEQFDIERSFHEKQRLADQLELNKISAKQQKKLAKIRKNNEKAQARRLNEERDALKKQQMKIETDLERKQQAYLHNEMNMENVTPAETISAKVE